MADEARNVEILKGAYKSWSDSKGGSVDAWLNVCADNIAFGSLAQGAAPGDRQRIFFARGRSSTGPWSVGAPVLDPVDGTGELGHATAVVHDGELLLLFQERIGRGRWHYALAGGELTG